MSNRQSRRFQRRRLVSQQYQQGLAPGPGKWVAFKCSCCDDLNWAWVPDGYRVNSDLAPTGRMARRDSDGVTGEVWA